jgi:hypothetical protein
MAEKQKRGPGKFKERVVKAARDSGMTVVGETPGKEITEDFLPGDPQESLPMDTPAVPQAVRNGKMYVNFNEPHYSLDRNDERKVGLVMSMRLAPEHKDHLHEKIERGWAFLVDEADKRLDVNGIPDHSVELFLSPEDTEPVLSLQAVGIDKVSIVKVADTGKGKTTHYYRLSFVVMADAGDHVDFFATKSFGAAFWLSMWEPQKRLRK